MWDITATLVNDNPNEWDITGTVDVGAGFDWTASGDVLKESVRYLDTYFRADNPQADECQSGWVDYFEYHGTGTRRSQSGNWNNYCGGAHYGYGQWSAATYQGDCAAYIP